MRVTQKSKLQDKCDNLGAFCEALFDQTKQSWEDAEAYRVRMQMVKEVEDRLELYRMIFDAENYDLSNSHRLGYLSTEMIQFFFGGQLIKGAAKGVGKGVQFIKKAGKVEKGIEGVKVKSNVLKIEKLSFNTGVLEGFIKHAFQNGRHFDLGLSIETMASKGINLVENNISLLKAGDNTLIGYINGVQKSFKVFVHENKIMSVNMYPGISNRAIQGQGISYGNITWK